MNNILQTLQTTYQQNPAKTLSLLPDLFQAVEDGRVIELPCRDNQPLYKISMREPCEAHNGDCLYPDKDDCTECRLTCGIPFVEEYRSSLQARIKGEAKRYYEALGKTVFLTRSAAEQALKEREI